MMSPIVSQIVSNYVSMLVPRNPSVSQAVLPGLRAHRARTYVGAVRAANTNIENRFKIVSNSWRRRGLNHQAAKPGSDNVHLPDSPKQGSLDISPGFMPSLGSLFL